MAGENADYCKGYAAALQAVQRVLRGAAPFGRAGVVLAAANILQMTPPESNAPIPATKLGWVVTLLPRSQKLEGGLSTPAEDA